MKAGSRLPYATTGAGHRLLLLLLVVGLGMSLQAQVVANFTASSTSGCDPLAVNFTNTSTGGPFTSYFWDLGNGNTSVLQHPFTIYNAPGSYTVTLIVTGSGSRDTLTLPNFITVFQHPDVVIGSNPTSGCVPMTVNFTNNSIAYPGPITSQLWDFGDGFTSTQPNPSHTYTAPGTYNVVLSVLDGNGCAATATSPISIQALPPITANFSVNPGSSCGAPVTVGFTDLSTGPGPFTYSWDFGDGSPLDAAPNPSHIYTSNGSFTVTLALSNGSGCTDTLVMPNAVVLTPLNAAFTASPPQVCQGSAVSFMDMSTGVPTGWTWDFGDGNTSTAQSPSHAYGAPGFYTVQLVVNRGPSCSDTVVQVNSIEVLPIPTANFVALNPTSCQDTLTVGFVDNSTGAVNWLWDFGDGNTSTSPSPSHFYAASGSYTVSLTVTNSLGCQHTFTLANYVQLVPPVAAFGGAPVTGCVPLNVGFTDLSSTTFGSVVGWEWTFGDGGSSILQHPSTTYGASGTYTVTLVVHTSGGCTDTLVMPAYVQVGDDPLADFVGSPDTVCYDETVSFTDLSSGATAWQWTFGDGGTSTLQNPSYVYNTALGCFTVTLIASNNGCLSTMTRNNYVCVEGTIASFTASPGVACATPAVFTFTNTSQGTDLVSYWNYGDGTLDTVTDGMHTYTTLGTFAVQLISEDTVTGCRDTATQQVTVSSPVGGFMVDTLGGCTPLTVTFTDLTAGGATYQWDFGDGGTSTAQHPLPHVYTASGNFMVTQVVRDANGCSDTTVAGPILVHGVVANFSAVPAPTCPNTNIQFTSLATSDTSLTSWAWDFGDGDADTLQAPLHAYGIPGTYTVTMTATDDRGCSATQVRNVVITRPIASFNASDTLLCPGETFTFSSTSTGAGPLVRAWDFGDGNVAGNAGVVSHVYASNGSYTVQLTVTDVNGCQDSMTQSITVQVPVASFTLSTTTDICPPLVDTFLNTSTGNYATYTWDFGDGSPPVNNNPSPVHIYNSPGSFTITLIVRSPTGCADTLALPAGVTVNAPAATFDFMPAVTCPGQPVAYVVDPPGTYNAIWSFGDGNGATGDTAVHAYGSSGTFPIKLLVGYASGTEPCFTSATGPVNDSVYVLPAPVAAFGYSDTVLCLADSVHFHDSTAYGGGPGSFAWTFGDGGTDTVQHPVHFYSVPGAYTVAMTVTDTLGCSAADTVVAAVRLYDYQAGFMAAPQVVCPYGDVLFTDTSYSDTTLVAWNWDFGDSTTGTGDSLVHSYADSGWYDVRLVITTAVGCQDSLLVPHAVYVQVPVGSFSLSTDTTCPLQPVTFTFIGGSWITPVWYFGNGDSLVGGDTVTYAYPATGTYGPYILMMDTLGCTSTAPAPSPVTVVPGPVAALAIDSLVHCAPGFVRLWDISTYASAAASVHWDFGDGNVATGAPALHYYAAPGYYTVQLAVMDALGCSDTALGVDTVRIHQQVAAFGADATTGCLPVTVQFSDSSWADTTLATWVWLFGDGGTGSGMNPSHTYTDTGAYAVTLVVTTVMGCSDTIVLPGFIDIDYPDLPRLWAVTVEGDQEVAAVFHPDTSTLHASYELWRETSVGTYVHASTETAQADTVLLDVGSPTLSSSHCYRPQVVDECGDSTALSLTTVHCTVELLAMGGMDQNTLLWTPYIGWGTVLGYDVFAVQGYDTSAVTYLGSVGGSVTSFVDSTVVCEELRSYRVRAVGSAPQERSWSDSSAARPVHTPPSYVPSMVTATVLNNQDVTVTWDTAQFVGAGDYMLYRSTDAINWTALGTIPHATPGTVDMTANVGAQSYSYRVTVADSCLFWTPPSGVARSILLELDGSNGTAQMNWNAYGNWAGGVDHYALEARPLNGGTWGLFALLPGNTLTFHDHQGLPGEPGVCYRVTAHEAGGNAATSMSNEVCFTLDVWVPNTITPNGDGFNDALIIRALAGYPGTGIHIYNRWGNLVYATDDYQNDWQGTRGKTGEALPDGTYYWVLHVSDGRTLKGYVTLLR